METPDIEAMERYLQMMESMRKVIERAAGIPFDMLIADMEPDLRLHGMAVMRHGFDASGNPTIEIIPADEFYASPDEVGDDR